MDGRQRFGKVVVEMATNYEQIAKENVGKYGTDIERYGPTLLAHLYSERTHFVYELLQNAEDAIARRVGANDNGDFPKGVSFRLFPDRLEFRHFGKLFDEADVRGICGLVEGTAANDPSRIGKFGIGFKSVYAYARCPEIHSGDEHFQIQDYVHPRSAQEVDLSDGETLFILPFDHSKVTPQVVFKEIAGRLQDLGSHTLLFLRCVDEVRWGIQGGAKGTYRRDAGGLADFQTIRLLSLCEGKESCEDYIVFEQDLGTDGPSNAKIAVAFRLENDSESNAPYIAGLRESPLSVFFPTKIETKLKFLIHGPYNTTPHRETIHEDDKWNRDLIEQTASLVADILSKIRDKGLLTVSFLESLPLRSSDFPEHGLFRPIYDTVRTTLKEQPLLPAADGTFVSAQRAKLASSAGLRDLLTDRQLATLYGTQKPIKWLPSEITRDKSPELYTYLTKELDIEEVTPEKFAQRFCDEFIAGQSDEWVVRFYAFLTDQRALWQEEDWRNAAGPLRNRPFIRLADNSHVAPFRADNVPNAYLPPEGDTEFPTVKGEIVADHQARKFLETLGLTRPDVVAEVLENILPRYERKEEVSAEQHTRDLENILKAMRTAEDRHKTTLETKLKETAFLRAVRLDSAETRFMLPSGVYLRTPPLETYFEGCHEEVWFIHESLSDEDPGLLKSLGAEDKPRRRSFLPSFDDAKLSKLRQGRRSRRQIELTDYELHGLVNCLERIKEESPHGARKLAGILWEFLESYLSVPGFFQGYYCWLSRRYNGNTEFDAHFLERLRGFAWLPSTDGQWYKSSDLSLDDLPEDFAKNEVFERILQMRPRAVDVLAREYGLDPQALNFLRNNPDEQAFLQRRMAQKRAEEAQKPAGPPPGGVEVATAEKDETSKKETKSDKEQVRLETRVYVKPAGLAVEDEDTARKREKQGAIGDAGIQKVLQCEHDNGREPKYKGQTYPGYDIESTNPSGEQRYIEVKSLPGDWGERGVALSATQFTKAQELGEQFWLYVVERAEGTDYEINAIQNPAHLANQFLFDHGWKALGHKDRV